MKKVVRITIEADNEFVRMLQATCSLSKTTGPREYGKPRTALAHLGALVLCELRGGLEEQVRAIEADPDWRGHVRVLTEARTVQDVSEEGE